MDEQEPVPYAAQHRGQSPKAGANPISSGRGEVQASSDIDNVMGAGMSADDDDDEDNGTCMSHRTSTGAAMPHCNFVDTTKHLQDSANVSALLARLGMPKVRLYEEWP